jgi:ABC-type branched-subunit amino acid transport system substrate-binding protein
VNEPPTPIGLKAIVLCAAGLGALHAVHAADIVVGQVAPLKNPASVANQMRAGIELYFDFVNRTGGLGPDRLKLATKDRADASDSAARTRELLREARPVALIGMQGTGPMEALVKEGVFAEAAAVPIVGIRTGAASLHTPAIPWLFHTRASYGAEMGKIVEHLRTIGLRRFAILHENTPFGREGRGHAEAALAAAGLAPLAVVGYERSSPEVAAAVGAIARVEPHAVLSAGDTTDVAEFHKALKGSGSRA